jgi:hypothetical protein
MFSAKGLNISFSNVSFNEIAPFVGLDPRRQLYNVPCFNLHRSRIPTSLFKAIVEDMDILLTQYGNLQSQATEDARSRFLAPVGIISQTALLLLTTALYHSDLQSLSGTVWWFYQKHARATKSPDKRQDRLSFQGI